MTAFAAVMTGKGTGAISTIHVFGDAAETVVKKIFKPSGKAKPILQPGKVLLGTIVDAEETIDHVTIGCEGPDTYAINCHGNPLIVEMIMQSLGKQGVTLLTADRLLTKILTAQKHINTIELEAKLVQPLVKTIEGTKLIANQIDGGLAKKAAEWLKIINTESVDQIKDDADRILKNSRTAKLIINGCKAAIIGPPNTGKSTLLNCLAGRQKAIVTDIKGTTRDWVSARCKIGPLSIELIDTAGLDKELAAIPENVIEKVSQQKTTRILEDTDLVLLVLDNSQAAALLNAQLVEAIAGKRILTVLNKSDLPAKLDTGELPKILANTVQISAKFETGIEDLAKKIQQLAGAADFDLHTAVCFTARQENLLMQLKNAESKEQATSVITELLNGQLPV
ncbi:MAG: GTP-binding protein [Phycisphaerae bacterium]|nr:GTP-binding protein [Phycisphaerae bacterium]NIP52841.1 GTP-binding protein [Phycisphaerae bacterium]NIS51862.1 GTP-binding protein [Phycisphaerae bacterium]NIU09380.1 GTP-binding protein [Phycisphaerae bacterium]NIU57613.1 GTP-binding protein [Phycisphaerae bacterium]